MAMLEIETLRKAALEVETLQKAVLEVETLKNGLSSLEILHCDIETITNKFAELAHDYTQTTQQVKTHSTYTAVIYPGAATLLG